MVAVGRPGRMVQPAMALVGWWPIVNSDLVVAITRSGGPTTLVQWLEVALIKKRKNILGN